MGENLQLNSIARRERPDFFKKTWLKLRENNCHLVSCISVSVLVSAGLIVLSIYYALYAYQSPDPKNCYFTIGLEDVVSADKGKIESQAKAAGISLRKGYPIDVAFLFHTFFTWGLWNIVAQVAVVLVTLVVYFLIKPAIALFWLLPFTSAVGCSSLLQFFLGLVWRFSYPGRLASGELLLNKADLTEKQINDAGYQLQGGSAMKTILWVQLAAFSALGLLMFVSCAFAYCFHHKNFPDTENADGDSQGTGRMTGRSTEGATAT